MMCDVWGDVVCDMCGMCYVLRMMCYVLCVMSCVRIDA